MKQKEEEKELEKVKNRIRFLLIPRKEVK